MYTQKTQDQLNRIVMRPLLFPALVFNQTRMELSPVCCLHTVISLMQTMEFVPSAANPRISTAKSVTDLASNTWTTASLSCQMTSSHSPRTYRAVLSSCPSNVVHQLRAALARPWPGSAYAEVLQRPESKSDHCGGFAARGVTGRIRQLHALVRRLPSVLHAVRSPV